MSGPQLSSAIEEGVQVLSVVGQLNPHVRLQLTALGASMLASSLARPVLVDLTDCTGLDEGSLRVLEGWADALGTLRRPLVVCCEPGTATALLFECAEPRTTIRPVYQREEALSRLRTLPPPVDEGRRDIPGENAEELWVVETDDDAASAAELLERATLERVVASAVRRASKREREVLLVGLAFDDGLAAATSPRPSDEVRELHDAIARRLLSALGDGVRLARVGVHELVVLASDLPASSAAQERDRILEHVRSAVLRPFWVGGVPLSVLLRSSSAVHPVVPGEALLTTVEERLRAAPGSASPGVDRGEVGVARAFYDALAARDPVALERILAPDVLFNLPAAGRPVSPFRGREQVVSFLLGALPTHTSTTVKNVQTFADGNAVLVSGHHDHTGGGGETLRLAFEHRLRCEAGQVHYLSERLQGGAARARQAVDDLPKPLAETPVGSGPGGSEAVLDEVQGALRRERTRVADRLHDDVLQLLMAARQELTELRSGDQRAADHLEQDLIDATAALRALISSTHEDALAEVRLGEALRRVADDAARRGRFDVDLQVEPAAEGVHDGLIRDAARELLLNAARHAHADLVHVRVRLRSGYVELSVSDDRRGIDETQRRTARERGHLGLGRLERVAKAAAGRFVLEAVRPRGTRAVLCLPAPPLPSGADGDPS